MTIATSNLEPSSFHSAIDEGLRYATAHGSSVEFATDGRVDRGSLVRIDQQLLVIAVNPSKPGPLTIRAGDPCSVTVFCGIGMLAFESVVRDVDADEGMIVVAIDDAKAIQAPQRRRFWRTPCRNSARVSIAGDRHHSCQGALLDISQDGMACLVENKLVDGATTDTQWRVTFKLTDGFTPLTALATLRSQSPASDADRCIMRFQFDFGEHATCTRDDIADAISRASR